MVKFNRILPVIAIYVVALGGCSDTTTDFSKYHKDKETVKKEDPSLNDNQIKVMSFNIRNISSKDTGKKSWEVRKTAFIPMIEDHKPTVVGIQEAHLPQQKWLGENWKDYGYVGKGRSASNPDKDEFVPVFYRTKAVELVKWDCFWLSETPDVPGSKSWDSKYPRIATWAIFRHIASGKKFFFINTHIDVGSTVAPGKSMEVLVNKMSGLNPEGLPVVLTGDFNQEIDSDIFSRVKAFMTNVRLSAPITDSKYTYTGFGTAKHMTVVDHIFCTGFKALKFETIDKVYQDIPHISDHYPVIGKLEYLK